MANFEKIVKVTDAVLDCIPVVSSFTNAAHVLYKLAHKVDALSPVAPGLKTSIKIHTLSKENFDCFIGAVPILGNIFKLMEFVLRAIHHFDYKPFGIFPVFDDDFLIAVKRNNKEIIHLCLENNALDDPKRAASILEKAAYMLSNEVFKEILNHRNDWSSENLMKALVGSCWLTNDTKAQNASDILDFWITNQKVLDEDNVFLATVTIKSSLERGQTVLAGRVLDILPDAIPFRNMQEILLKCSCAQYNYRGEVEETGVLSAEQRDALIAKSTRPSLEHLKEYYGSVGCQLRKNTTPDNYRETHFDTLNKLLDLGQYEPDEIVQFIATTLCYDEFDFTESLVKKYEGKLTPQTKLEILKKLLPSESSRLTSHKKRAQLFDSWVNKWKSDISAQAHELYTNITESGNCYVKVVQRTSQSLADIKDDGCPSAENLEAVNTQFKQVLLKVFPGCDKLPQEKTV